MKKITLALCVAAALYGPAAFAKAKLVEKVTKKGNELVIPYERYVLDNGTVDVLAPRGAVYEVILV